MKVFTFNTSKVHVFPLGQWIKLKVYISPLRNQLIVKYHKQTL